MAYSQGQLRQAPHSTFHLHVVSLRLTLGQNGVLRYGHFSNFLKFFGDRMANLGLIDFKLVLYIKVNVNDGQNKLKVYISKNLAKMAMNLHKIGQMSLLGKNIKWA